MLSGLWPGRRYWEGLFELLLSRSRYFIYKTSEWFDRTKSWDALGKEQTRSNHVGLLGYLQVLIPPNVKQVPVLRWWVVKISPLFGCATGGYFKHWSTLSDELCQAGYVTRYRNWDLKNLRPIDVKPPKSGWRILHKARSLMTSPHWWEANIWKAEVIWGNPR